MQVTVLTGGTSAERDVAIASAGQVVSALRQRDHLVSVVDIAHGHVPEADEASLFPDSVGSKPPATEALRAQERHLLVSGLADIPAIRDADVLFLALHGGWGEDGTLQALLDVIGTPYTGSGSLASAVAMDKDFSKRLFRLAGITTADWLMAPCTADEVDRHFGWPVIVKPSTVTLRT